MADEMEQAAEIAAIITDPTTSVNAARVALGKTGTDDCTDCGDPIPLERKKAYPAATRCIFCQTELTAPKRK